jgi:hypothetical protein
VQAAFSHFQKRARLQSKVTSLPARNDLSAASTNRATLRACSNVTGYSESFFTVSTNVVNCRVKASYKLPPHCGCVDKFLSLPLDWQIQREREMSFPIERKCITSAFPQVRQQNLVLPLGGLEQRSDCRRRPPYKHKAQIV